LHVREIDLNARGVEILTNYLATPGVERISHAGIGGTHYVKPPRQVAFDRISHANLLDVQCTLTNPTV